MGLGAVNIDVGGVIGGIGTLAKDIRAAITGKSVIDPNQQAALENKLIELEQGAMNAQAKINEIEAASTSKFTSSWRPACGWLCVLGLAWTTFITPVWTWLSAIIKLPLPPTIDTGILVSLLIGMLGLGTLRTFEKTKDVQGKH